MDEHDTDTVELVVPAPSRGDASVPPAKVDLAALSHTGKVRSNNEDHYYVARFERSMQTLLTNLPAGQLPHRTRVAVHGMLVADGMGGVAGGEVASCLAITTLIELVLQTPDWIMQLNEQLVHKVSERMKERFTRLNAALSERARTDPKLFGMGTTMTLACNLGEDLLIAHVGDSRAYLFRQGQLHRLTRDHTVAESLLYWGVISPEEAARHKLRHVLTGVISTREEKAKPELSWLRLADGDQLLLCTDGLTELVPDPAIAEVLQVRTSANDACDALVTRALEAGGRDNVTVVLARYHFPPSFPTQE